MRNLVFGSIKQKNVVFSHTIIQHKSTKLLTKVYFCGIL